MLKASVGEQRFVNLEGLSKTWVIKKKEDVVLCDAEAFVRVCPQNQSLVSLICAKNENVERKRTDVSLAQNQGLRGLIRLRNEADDQLVQDKDQETACTLFDTPSEKPKVKLSRDDKKAMRSNAESLTINLEACGTLEVLRPAQVNENLFIKYDEEM